MRAVFALVLTVGMFAGRGDAAPAARATEAPPPVADNKQEEFEGLPEGFGREAVYFNCTACHSIKQVDQQRMTREDWDKLLDVMVETNGMHPLQPWARTRILNYLATHFGPEDEEDWDGLPPGEGRELVFYTCQACHSLAIVKQQGLSREFWDDTLTWMVEEQAMPELDEEDRTLVLDYLAANFGPDSRQP
jgi:cytochrome c